MRPGDIILLRLPQPDLLPGKLRPVLVLAELPGPFGDYLVCDISSQLHQETPQWDER
jgi:mRNA interferase MazF